MLRITVHDAIDHVKLKLEGKLSGPWVADLDECWRATSPTLAGRELRLDLTAVDHIDTAGKYLLAPDEVGICPSRGAPFRGGPSGKGESAYAPVSAHSGSIVRRKLALGSTA
jgi:hypothetical protein